MLRPINIIHLMRGMPLIDIAAKFGVFVDEKHDKLPTLNWLPKLHKIPYKSRFIANSS